MFGPNCSLDKGGVGVLFRVWATFYVIVTEESAGFSVTMAVFDLEPPFWSIDTENGACFCGTMRDANKIMCSIFVSKRSFLMSD